MIWTAARVYHYAVAHDRQNGGISGQRWGIMICLWANERMGNTCGINPTMISHFRRVSKNTTSSLLSGLEEQGLIERKLDPLDKRGFRIILTEKGRQVTREMAPERMEYLNNLSNGLTTDEKETLKKLLGKLTRSILINEKLFLKFQRGNNEEKD